MRLRVLADLYATLADALADPPDWIVGCGRDWPLYDVLFKLEAFDLARRIAEIPSETKEERQLRYVNLLRSYPQIKWNESLNRDGRLVGPSTFQVWSMYQSVGLKIGHGELADHISVELAFVSYLFEQEYCSFDEAHIWRKARQLFSRRHISEWVTQLAGSLVSTQDAVYQPLGHVLLFLTRIEFESVSKTHSVNHSTASNLPSVSDKDCTLCGFCVQSCPHNALYIEETHDYTMLKANDDKCVACKRCIKVCVTNSVVLRPRIKKEVSRILVVSTRESCPICNQPTVSSAELAAIVEKVGDHFWLKLCLDCR